MIIIEKAIGPIIVPGMTAEGGSGKNSWAVTDWIGGYKANFEPWHAEALKYTAWKKHVREHVADQLPEAFAHAAINIRRKVEDHKQMQRFQRQHKLESQKWPKGEARGVLDGGAHKVTTMSVVRFNVHHDAENIHKGLVDSLTGWILDDDKRLNGEFFRPEIDRYVEIPHLMFWVERDAPVQPSLFEEGEE